MPNNPNVQVITESLFISSDGYTVGDRAGDALTANSMGILSMGSDGYFAHFQKMDGYGDTEVVVAGFSSATNNFGYARGILVPGTISSPYVISTACQANFVPSSPSFVATVAQGISSSGGGTVVILPVDNVSSITLTLNSNQIYPVLFSKIVSTSLTDLTIFV